MPLDQLFLFLGRLGQVNVVGFVTEVMENSASTTFSISDGTNIPTAVHGCAASVKRGDRILLLDYTTCWSDLNLAYLENIGKKGKHVILKSSTM
jgi:hypothetical protein